MTLLQHVDAIRAKFEAMPGAEIEDNRYKVMGKMFAIVSRGAGGASYFLIVKTDPHLAEILREQYAGIGHRSHLDQRFWISIDLDSDVPMDEVERLAASSYDLICAGLTRKQKSELAALST
jgi:predicted DNA-binding protein (MmcQ/YjbR family)